MTSIGLRAPLLSSLVLVAAGVTGLGVALVATLISSIEPLVLLVAAGAILVLASRIWSRRTEWWAPAPLVALALLVYFPLRALLLMSFGLDNTEGINVRVLTKIGTPAVGPAAADVFLVTTFFVLSAELVMRLRRPPVKRPDEKRELLGTYWPIAAMVVGILCQVAQAISTINSEEVTGGVVEQLVQMGSFSFALGILLANSQHRPSWVSKVRLVLIGLSLLLSITRGSKEPFVQVVLACVFVAFSQSDANNQLRRKTRMITVSLVGLLGIVLVFAVFPVIFTYHRLLIRGYSASEAIAAVPGELAQNSLILGTPRISNGVIQYGVDSLLYVTDRLHGFDSLLLSVSAPPNPDILTSQSLALSPLGFAVPSSVWMSGVSDVGLYFAHTYWGSPASDSTHIAPTVFGQARLAFGDPAVVVASVLLGILTGVAARFYRRATPRDVAIAFTLVIAALSFERDALAMIVTAERHILALGLLLLLIRLENRSQRSGAKVVRSETHAASLVH